MPNPTRSPEDAGIMAARTILERFYSNQLTSSEQAAWSTYLAMVPPQDATGSEYTAGTPTAFNQVKVLQPTLFAWGTIWGWYRFQKFPAASPMATDRPTMGLSSPGSAYAAEILTVTPSGSAAGLVGILFYSTRPAATPPKNTVSNSRPCCAWNPTALPSAADITPGLVAQWGGLTSGLSTAVYAHAVDANGQLVVSPTAYNLVMD
jgi:hypothetical protein